MNCLRHVSATVLFVLLTALLAAPAFAQSEPRWIIAHKVNQLVVPYLRTVTWAFPPNHYPGCFGDAGFLGVEESLHNFFVPAGPYANANGLEFDIWYNEPGDNINGYGADQQDIHGDDVVTGRWYVSHEPCDDMHVPLEDYVAFLKDKLDTYGTSRVALIYVDMKVVENHILDSGGNPTFDPIIDVRTKLRSGLGSHYNNINFIYSTAEWTGRGAFEEDNFISTMRPNEVVGIDEDNDDAADDDTLAALVAITWAAGNDIDAVYLTDDTEETRLEFIHWMEEYNYPSVVGGWTISSDTDTTADGNDSAIDFWNEGVNLFLVQNYFEGVDGTGAYTYLKNRITSDPDYHLATGLDRPWQEPPIAEANGPYNVSEGGAVPLSSAGTTDPDGDTLLYDWDLDNNGTFETSGANPLFYAAGRNGPDTQTVVLRVRDGTFSVTDTATVNIHNVAPSITSVNVSPASLDEGGSVEVSGAFSDPGSGEVYSGTAMWSDGTTTPLLVNSGARTFSTIRSFPDDHPETGTPSDNFTVDLTVNDGDGGSDSATSPAVTVNNVAPSNLTLGTTPIDEHGVTTLSGSFDDPGVPDTFTVEIDWGDPLSPDNAQIFHFGASDSASPGVTWTAATRSFTIEHQYLDDNPGGTPVDVYPVAVAVTDDDTGSTSGATSVAVSNLDPAATIDSVIDQLTGLTIAHVLDGVSVPGELDVALLGTTIEVVGSYSDTGTLDTHAGTINWDDGTGDELLGLIPDPPPNASNGVTETASHAYDTSLAEGSYGVVLTIADDDTGHDAPVAEILVVGAEGALEDALDDIQDVIDGGGLDAAAEAALYQALYRIIGNPLEGGDGYDDNGALDHLDLGQFNSALVKIQQAIAFLQDAEAADGSLDLTAVKAQVTLTANSIVRGAIDEAAAVADKPSMFRKIAQAEALLEAGNIDLAAGDYLAALEDYIDAARKVESMINP